MGSGAGETPGRGEVSGHRALRYRCRLRASAYLNGVLTRGLS